MNLSTPLTAWLIIPARGGSVGVPRKNLRSLAGRPLIAHTITTALSVRQSSRVLVITDDVEISSVARDLGAEVILEENQTPSDETLDEKVLRNLSRLRDLGAADDDLVVTLQPTSPLLRAGTVEKCIQALIDDPSLATVLTVTDDRHLTWSINPEGVPTPNYSSRVNRQALPTNLRETGGVIATRVGILARASTRVTSPVGLVEVDQREALDIDTFSDFAAAEHFASRLTVVIRCDAATHLGMGHLYRSLAIAYELARHDVTIVTSESLPLGQRLLSEHPVKSATVRSQREFLDLINELRPNIVFMDVLDTDAPTIQAVRTAAPASKIVTFEDQGSGARHCDLLVAEFIPIIDSKSPAISGIRHSILAPSFETARPRQGFSEKPNAALILFGGTDPSNLGLRAARSLSRLKFAGRVQVVRGMGARTDVDWPTNLDLSVQVNVRHMPGLIREADFAFTSAGRTVIELASMGVPSLCLAQNEKEMSHTHTTLENGVVMLGLGVDVTDDALDAAVHRFLEDPSHRSSLRQRALANVGDRSNHATLSLILATIGVTARP